MTGRSGPAWTAADILARSGDRDRERAQRDSLMRFWYTFGRQSGIQETAGYCATHTEDLAEAFTAGQRIAAREAAGGTSGFDIGWRAAMDRLADAIGGRAAPAHPSALEITRWTRHAPRCVHGGRGGRYYCKRAGCLPGPRADFGKPAPWDMPGAMA